jgi:ribonuclease HI
MKRRQKTPAPRPARLFAEPESASGPAADACIANIDGAARGNPGPASYAVILRRPEGRVLAELKKYVGRTTNNVAEYYALIAALDYAHAHRIRKLRIRSDSELLVRQMQGRYKVKSAALRPLHEQARKLAQRLEHFSIEHIPREQNREADALANAALDRRATGAPSASFGAGHRPASDTAALTLATRHSPLATHKVRARYSHGALHPAEPLDLAEGQEVEITIHQRNDS